MTVSARNRMPLADIDLVDNDQYVNAVPYAHFDLLRREDPVHWHPERAGPGFWAVTRYDDVVAVSRDTLTYSSELGATALEDLEPDALEARKSMIDMDPPAHTRLRMQVADGFGRHQVAAYEGWIRELVARVLDTALPRGSFDVVEHIATAVPIRVLCRLMGAPARDERMLADLIARMAANTDPDLADVLLDSEQSRRYRLLPFRSPAGRKMQEYARWLRSERAADPQDDLVTRLMRARMSGRPMRRQQQDAMFLLLMVVGSEATRSALSLGVQAFLEHPGEWARLRADRGLLDSAVEEVLRWSTPVHHFRRTATRDTEMRGRGIQAGDKVVIWYTSANRDEDVFEDPYRFDVGRDPNPQIAFGRGGPHRCLGEHLARLEIRTVLDELLARDVRLEAAGPPARIRSNFTNGLKHLPVRVSRSRRKGG